MSIPLSRAPRRLSLLVLAALALAPASAHAQGGVEDDKARGQAATASSVQSAGEFAGSAACANPACGPEAAVDGSLSTRWASDRSEPQFWQVDLGRPRLVDEVRVFWQDAYAARYLVGTSLDGVTFDQVGASASGEGVVTTGLPVREARYVRITGLERRRFSSGRIFGFSIWDVGVFGPADPPGGPTAAAPAPTAPSVQAAAPRALAVLAPFPVVRIRGTLTRAGARIGLLGVRAPVGARIEVRCVGGGCARRSVVYRSRRGYVRARRF